MKTLPEVIERVRKDSPAALGSLDDKASGKLLRAAFTAIAQEVTKAPDGIVRIAGLGAFRVRTVEAKAEGKGGGRRVMFKPAAPKAAKAGKAGRAGRAAAKDTKTE